MDELEKNKKPDGEQLGGKELYELKKKQKEELRKKETRKSVLKKIGRYILYGGIAALIVGGLGWFISTRPSVPETEIISKKGIHWHSELSIYVKGVKQEISANIGIGAAHRPIHTHDTTGVLHLELQGLVRKQDITLGQFFENWGKDMRSFGADIKMTVNGQENAELENYVMRDKDKIELRFTDAPTEEPIASQVQEISIVSGNLFFNPKNLTLVKGQPVRITFTNVGFHTFTIDELGVNVQLRGGSGVVEFTPTKSGTFQYYCAIPGHREDGMFGSLKVE